MPDLLIYVMMLIAIIYAILRHHYYRLRHAATPMPLLILLRYRWLSDDIDADMLLRLSHATLADFI